MAHSALYQVPFAMYVNSDSSLRRSMFKGYNVPFQDKLWASGLSLDLKNANSGPRSRSIVCMSVQQAIKCKVAVSPVSLEDAKEPPMHLYKNKAPYTAIIVSVERVVGPNAPGETCHIVIDHGGNVPYWEGQSYGVIPPGENPKKPGSPQNVRLYSIASTRYGDSFNGKTASLCVRRAVYYNPETGLEDPLKQGVCSNFLCDSKPGDKILVTGAKMVNQGYMVDLNKPLVFHVGRLGEAYDEWVHQPIVSKETPRFFANGVLELMTRTPWWTIPTVWLPVVCLLISSAVKNGLPPYHLVMSLIAGVCFWTLLEYALQRFLFHIKTTGYWGNTIHYLLPGCHHKHPMDGLRLVFPPAASAILVLWNVIKLLAPASCAPAFLAGALLGYVIHDCTHYYLHYGNHPKEFQLVHCA